MVDKKKLDVTDQDTSNPDTTVPTDPNANTTPAQPATPDVEMFQAGDSGNRPSDPPANFIYYSINTGSRDRYLGGGSWENIDNLHV